MRGVILFNFDSIWPMSHDSMIEIVTIERQSNELDQAEPPMPPLPLCSFHSYAGK